MTEGRRLTLEELVETRHPGTKHFVPLFSFSHLPGALQDVSRRFYNLAWDMIANLQDGPELTAGLRKLLEAKDCMVRQAVIDAKG